MDNSRESTLPTLPIASTPELKLEDRAGRTVPTARRNLLPGFLHSPFAVAVLTFAVYGAWLGYQWHIGRDARTFINIGRGFLLQSHASASISSIDPHAPFVEHAWGNDGQFFYFIAVDPVNARYYEDSADYRYRKILYPILARTLALGRMDLIPAMLILINWLAIVGGTLALAWWLKLRQLSPWWALAFGFFPGISLALSWDLTEPLSYALVILGVYLYGRGGPSQFVWSPLAFALASLARDKAILFGLVFGTGLLFVGLDDDASLSTWPSRIMANARRAIPFLVIVSAPLGIWVLYLRRVLKLIPSPANAQLGQPLSGLTAHSMTDPTMLAEIISVYLPALVVTSVALWTIWRGARRWELGGLLFIVWVSVIALNAKFYEFSAGATRTSIAVVLMTLYCLPVIDRYTHRSRAWLWLALGLWLLKDVVYAVEAPFWVARQLF